VGWRVSALWWIGTGALLAGGCGGGIDDQKSTVAPDAGAMMGSGGTPGSGGTTGPQGRGGSAGPGAGGVGAGAAGRGGFAQGGTGFSGASGSATDGSATGGTGDSAAVPYCCVNNPCPDGYDCVSTRCLPKPNSGACWRNEDCSSRERCDNARVCQCVDDCHGERMGQCVPVRPTCCSTSEDCLAGARVPCVAGRCKSIRLSGTCWNDTQCAPGATCLGVSVCPCGSECDASDTAGYCLDPRLDAGSNG
jgi:hypothetical protein